MDKNSKIFESILFSPNHNEQIVTIICEALSSCLPKTWNRIHKILTYLIKNNHSQLKKECYLGLPEDLPSLRALIWKINFKYLPKNIKKWDNTLKEMRKQYKDIKEAYLLRQSEEIKILEEIENKINVKNGNNKSKKEDLIKKSCNFEIENENKEKIIKKLQNQLYTPSKIDLEGTKETEVGTDSCRNLLLLARCTDRNLLELINKDINRTHASFHFFSKRVNDNIKLNQEELDKMNSHKKNVLYQNYKEVYTKGRKKNEILKLETHSDVLERLLYIYAKINKDVGYIQGMNEIIAPIYYCYSLDKTCDMENIEADTFWSFSSLMEDIKKHFININDKQKGGICDKINLFELMVSKIHKDIFIKFRNNNIRIFQFAFQWINLFFSQQFILPDLIRIWDTIFCEDDRYDFVYYFGLAILEYKKSGLLGKNFFETVEELQKKELADVNKIIKIALEIKKVNENKINEILFFYDINIFKTKTKTRNPNKKKTNNKEGKNNYMRNNVTLNYIHVNPSLFNIKK
jgi:hypothetical protein